MDTETRHLADERSTVHDVVQIFRYLRGASKDEEKSTEKQCNSILPSEYMKQMFLATDERADYYREDGRKQKIHVTAGGTFEIAPSIVMFQRFTPGHTYNAPLTIRNRMQSARYLKLSCEPDPFFLVETRGPTHSTMVAPGLAQTYTVKFTPEEKRDYDYRIKFSSDAEEFAIPVVAIGPRPILDLPDRIDVPPTAAKIPSSRTILVRNIGDAPAIFKLYTDAAQFRAEPANGVIQEEEFVQLAVNFLPEKAGDFEGTLFLKYESGETLHSRLRGSAANCAIRLDRGTVRMEATYLGMSRSKLVTIHNRSDHVVRYKWMRFKDAEQDALERDKYKRLFGRVHDTELARSVDLVHYNVCTPDAHRLVCQRIYGDEIESLTRDDFEYNHLCFLLTPQKGEIWPRTSADVTVLFRAMEVGEISSVAYLEVTGRTDRIPLSLRGVGKGPVFRLNVLTIDMDDIYLCSVHNFEIIATNKGYIDGTLVHTPRPTDFGGTITVTPSSLTLGPDRYSSFNLSFLSNRKGKFVERIDFVVKESLEVISLHVKGCIVCPSLHFDKDYLHFGTVPLGFGSRQEAGLHNSSSMPVTFSIAVSNDGDQTAVTHDEFVKSQAKPRFPLNPREFAVSPDEGVVAPRSSLRITITYTANLARSGSSFVQVDMWDSDSDPVVLPITFTGSVAVLAASPAEITIPFCFVDFPYNRSLSVENKSDIDGHFYIIPQQVSDNTSTFYSLSTSQGYLKARQSKAITVTIITRVLGVQKTTLNMLTMGDASPVPCGVIVCNGQGPVISVQPTCLDFGESQVLQEKCMKFLMISDSPIPARYKITLGKKNTPWSVTPACGELQANASVEVQVKLYLRDVGKYTDRVLISVVNSRQLSLALSTNGVGCSIIFEPKIFPTFDMGVTFSHRKITYPVVMKNLSTRYHQLSWSDIPEMRIQKGRETTSVSTKFQISPMNVGIAAGASVVTNCTIRWNANATVSEDWYLFAQIQGQGKRELLGCTTFKVTFAVPQFVFDKKELTFRMNMSPYGDQMRQTDELCVTNKSRLNVNVQLSVDHPFYLVTDDEQLVQRINTILADTVRVRVRFSPKMKPKCLYSQNYNGILLFECDKHPSKEKIRCRGSVNFPNLVITPNDLSINCELGATATRTLTLINDGPVTVFYKLLWIGESIEINHHANDIDDSDANTVRRKSSPASRANRADSNNLHVETTDGPLKLATAPTNSPASDASGTPAENPETRPAESRATDNEPETMVNVTSEETRQFLAPLFDTFFVEEEETSALECIGTEPIAVESVNKILNIAPREGAVPPYTSQYLYLTFHGSKPLRLKAVAACEIVRGPTEMVTVRADADAVRYSVDKRVIDFGQRLFCEPCRSRITLTNHGRIAVRYETCERFETNRLKVEPSQGLIEATSSVQLTITYRPQRLGPFDVHFGVKVGHVEPLNVRVIGVGTFPQAFLDASRGHAFGKLPAEHGYRAVQALTGEFIGDKYVSVTRASCNSNDLDEDSVDLEDDGWVLINNASTLPGVVDVEMAFERILAARFVEKNPQIFGDHVASARKGAIPGLSCPEYVIDRGFLLLGRTTSFDLKFVNYGPWNLDVEMRPIDKKLPQKSGVSVEFQPQTNLSIGAGAALKIVCSPNKEQYTGKRGELNETIYLDVAHGCSIPVTIKGVVTYPSISIDTKILDFQDVLVGECLMLCLLIKNDGLIDCHWKAKLHDARSREEINPFYLYYDCDTFAPGQADVVNVYFKPRRHGRVESRLRISVAPLEELQTVTLRGRGLEHKLSIIKPAVTFHPVVPFTEIQESVVSVQNAREHPVEFFWHHLDGDYVNEDRVARALARYYRVEEILLPRRKPGDKLPSRLVRFYEGLVEKMARTLSDESTEDGLDLGTVHEDSSADLDKAQARRRRSSLRKSTASASDASTVQQTVGRSELGSQTESKSHKSRRRTKGSRSVASFDRNNKEESVATIGGDKPVGELFNLPTRDPEEIESLLHHYIDNLHKGVHSREKMEDPVKELFDACESKTVPPDDPAEPASPAKKLCIIFHGAPFTEYQETACRSAKVLGVPALSLNNAITEVVALSGSTCSTNLRKIIDDAYQEYMTKYIEQRDLSTARKSRTNDSSPRKSAKHRTETTLVGEPEVPEEQQLQESNQRAIFPRIQGEPDPLQKLNDAIDKDDSELTDSLSRCQWKIETIRLLLQVLPRSAGTARTNERSDAKSDQKSGQKSGRKQQDDNFLGIETGLLSEALRERLSQPDYENGFVLQSLRNVFIKDEIATLLTLLGVIGHVEYSLFVTFLNSTDAYDRKTRQLQDLARNEAAQKTSEAIKSIDEMSLFEYEQISREDRQLYLDAVLPTKRQNASSRRAMFHERLNRMKTNTAISPTPTISATRTDKSKLSETSKKRKMTTEARKKKNTSPSKASSGKIDASKKEPRSRDSSKSKKEKPPGETSDVAYAMDTYYSNLAAIQDIIRNWDPVKRTVNVSPRARGKSPTSARSKGTAVTSASKEESGVHQFHAWYVNASDPWSDAMRDLVVRRMSENESAKSVLPVERTRATPDLRPRLYSVLVPRNVERTNTDEHGAFRLVPVSLASGEGSVFSQSAQNDSWESGEITGRVEGNRANSRDRGAKLRNAAEDTFTSNGSPGLNGEKSAHDLESFPEGEVAARCVLGPGEIRRFKIIYKPHEEGTHKHAYSLTTVGGKGVTYRIEVDAVADLPRVDMNPAAVFPKVEDVSKDNANDPTFFLDTAVFHFGSLLVLDQGKRVHKREAQLKFRNVSTVEAFVSFHLEHNDEGSFSVEPDNLLIPPGQTESLFATAAAAKLGPLANRLLLCVRNNPRIGSIELRGNGCELDVEISEKQLSFDRVLLYRRETRVVAIRNNSGVPLTWRVEPQEPVKLVEPQITYSPGTGAIGPLDEQTIEFVYHARKVGVVENNAMIFKAFLREDDEDPIFTDVIVASGETYDVAVDINHANPIDLGRARVDAPTVGCFSIKNLGNYEIKYVVSLDKTEDPTKVPGIASLKGKLEVSPVAGVVRPQEAADVQVTFVARSEINIKESPILKCHLLDANKQAALVAEFPLTVSLVAYYARFRLYPYPDVDFGTLGICTRKTVYLNVENVGRFPLRYSIRVASIRHPSIIYMTQIKREAGTAGRDKDTASKKDRKSARTGSPYSKNKDPTSAATLSVGPFTVAKIEGVVDAGQTDAVAIDCYPEFVGSQEEQVIFVVDDSAPEDRHGRKLTLSVRSCVPAVDFHDLDAMFHENRVVDDIQDFRCPDEVAFSLSKY